MSETNTPWHTKAEKVTADGPYLGGIEHTVVDDEGSFIASCGVTLNDDAEQRARLIAAAPELLDALKGMVAAYEETDGFYIRYAREAIAKAEND